MFLLRISFLVSLTMTPVVVNGQEDFLLSTTESTKKLYDDGVLLQETFYEAMDSSFVDSTENDPNEHGSLRRDLQTTPYCQAIRPAGNTFVCGGNAGGSADPCRNSQATCSGLTYACTCSGIPDTTCTYCQLRGANAILCQQSGTSTTFVDLNMNFMSCTCMYVGNGQVVQNCHQPAPVSSPPPSGPPYSMRAPTESPGAPPVSGVPVQVPTPQPQPPHVPTTSTQSNCRANNPANVNLGPGSSCSTLPDYLCMCNGSQQYCSYCEVQTSSGILCQVSGSYLTYMDPTNVIRTCHCDYNNGQLEHWCFNQQGAVIPTAPTSQRASPGGAPVYSPVTVPTGGAPAYSPVTVPTGGAAAPTVPAEPKQAKKNNKRG